MENGSSADSDTTTIVIDRIHVARGFTAYQHYGAICDLPTAVNQSIQESTADTGTFCRQSTGCGEDSSPHTPSLIVASAVDAQYRDDDTLVVNVESDKRWDGSDG